MMYDLSHPLVWDVMLLGLIMGWVLCFNIVFPGQLNAYLIRLKNWIYSGMGRMRNMVPNKTDSILYAGMLIILAGIWWGDYTLSIKALWSGVWMIVVALYMALPEWLGDDETT